MQITTALPGQPVIRTECADCPPRTAFAVIPGLGWALCARGAHPLALADIVLEPGQRLVTVRDSGVNVLAAVTDWYALAERDGQRDIAFGPFATLAEADAYADVAQEFTAVTYAAAAEAGQIESAVVIAV